MRKTENLNHVSSFNMDGLLLHFKYYHTFYSSSAIACQSNISKRALIIIIIAIKTNPGD